MFAALTGVVQAKDLDDRASSGDPAAQFELGTMFDLGDGRPRDPRVAFELFRRAAEAGLPDAEFNVGVMLDSGRGTSRNMAEAATWYGRAAARGNHRAQFNLGLLYAAGDGVPRNPDLAAFWFRQAINDIAEAGRRLAALPASDRKSVMSAATPAAPRNPVLAGSAPIEFVWTAPAQPDPMHYLLEVRAVDRVGSYDIYSDFTDGSAILAPLRGMPGDYAWRVLTLSHTAARYMISEWQHFSVLAQPPER